MGVVLQRRVHMPEAEGSVQESPHLRRYAGVAPDSGGPTRPQMWDPVLGYQSSA
jgi:hypothetical protein